MVPFFFFVPEVFIFYGVNKESNCKKQLPPKETGNVYRK